MDCPTALWRTLALAVTSPVETYVSRRRRTVQNCSLLRNHCAKPISEPKIIVINSDYTTYLTERLMKWRHSPNQTAGSRMSVAERCVNPCAGLGSHVALTLLCRTAIKLNV